MQLQQMRRPTRRRLAKVISELVPLVRLILRDLDREERGKVAPDAMELSQNVESWLVELVPRVPKTLENARQFRAYVSVAIRRQLLTEIRALRRCRSTPAGFRLPEPPRSELAELEERLYVEDVLAAAERRIVHDLSASKGVKQAEGIRYAVRSYLRGEEPSALHLRFVLGISDPSGCLEKARVRLRMELADIWRRDLAGVRTSDGPIAMLFGGTGRRHPARSDLSQDVSRSRLST